MIFLLEKHRLMQKYLSCDDILIKGPNKKFLKNQKKNCKISDFVMALRTVKPFKTLHTIFLLSEAKMLSMQEKHRHIL